MYPETDIPVIPITSSLLASIRLPTLITDAATLLEEKYDLQPHIAHEIIKQKIPLEKYLQQFSQLPPETIAFILVELPKEIKSRFNLNPEHLKQQHFELLLQALQQRKITRESIIEILKEILETGTVNLEKYRPASLADIEAEIKTAILQRPEASPNAIMGMLMAKFRGKVPGKQLMELIQKHKK